MRCPVCRCEFTPRAGNQVCCHPATCGRELFRRQRRATAARLRAIPIFQAPDTPAPVAGFAASCARRGVRPIARPAGARVLALAARAERLAMIRAADARVRARAEGALA